jgi:hypothetical protein
MKRIKDVKLAFTWDDNKVEFLYENLPEHLFNDIEAYLVELEEHREEVGDDYNFCFDGAKRGQKHD